MGTCDACKYWRVEDIPNFGKIFSCSCGKFNLKYGRMYLDPDEVRVECDEGWGFMPGPKFGCVHHSGRK